jgi:hypothetical protein
MYSVHHRGYTIRAIDEGHIDFGLEIVGPGGDLLYFNHCCLPCTKWGYTDGNTWTEKEWRSALKESAEKFLLDYIDTKEDEYARL